MNLPNDIDIHTHTGAWRSDAVLCIDPVETETLPEGDGLMSVGIHPWNAGKVTPEIWNRFEKMLSDKRVVAVGETGFDRAKGPAIGIQEEVFARQVGLAAEYGMPVIIHCVRAVDLLLHTAKDMKKTQWIFHGFRGKPETAKQLLEAGIDLSFGKKFNQEAFDLTPPGRRYGETD